MCGRWGGGGAGGGRRRGRRGSGRLHGRRWRRWGGRRSPMGGSGRGHLICATSAPAASTGSLGTPTRLDPHVIEGAVSPLNAWGSASGCRARGGRRRVATCCSWPAATRRWRVWQSTSSRWQSTSSRRGWRPSGWRRRFRPRASYGDSPIRTDADSGGGHRWSAHRLAPSCAGGRVESGHRLAHAA